MQLYIGNKNYSSWSMRPWVLLRHFNIPFDEVMVRFDSISPGEGFKQTIAAVTPAGRVPVLVDGKLAVWDTLAIAETLAERFPQHAMWPRHADDRALARSLCAEMHSGFGALRNAFPMNIEVSMPEVGRRVLAEQTDAAADLARICAMWGQALAASGGPFLFGEFGIVDAFFAPVVSRLRSYALPVPAEVAEYMTSVWVSPGVAAWVADALQEKTYVAFDEPYRASRD